MDVLPIVAVRGDKYKAQVVKFFTLFTLEVVRKVLTESVKKWNLDPKNKHRIMIEVDAKPTPELLNNCSQSTKSVFENETYSETYFSAYAAIIDEEIVKLVFPSVMPNHD
jgi:hypothetical protein